MLKTLQKHNVTKLTFDLKGVKMKICVILLKWYKMYFNLSINYALSSNLKYFNIISNYQTIEYVYDPISKSYDEGYNCNGPINGYEIFRMLITE